MRSSTQSTDSEGKFFPPGFASLRRRASMSGRGFSEQIFGIQFLQRLWHEEAVLADDFAVETDFAAAVFRALDADDVPVHLRFVAVAHALVRLTRCEVKRA